MDPKVDTLRIDEVAAHLPPTWHLYYADDNSRSLYKFHKESKQLMIVSKMDLPCVFLQYSHYTCVYEKAGLGANVFNFDSTASGIHLEAISKFTGTQVVGLNYEQFQREAITDKYCGEYCLYFVTRRTHLMAQPGFVDDVPIIMFPLTNGMLDKNKWLIANWTVANRIGSPYKNTSLEDSLKEMLKFRPY